MNFFFEKKIKTEIKNIFADQNQESKEKIVEKDLERLPLIIQKWLKFSGVIEKEKPRMGKRGKEQGTRKKVK